MRRSMAVATLILASSMLATPAMAQESIFGVHIGGFIPTGEDGRTDGDVLRENLSYLTYTCSNADKIRCFNSFSVSGEYLMGFGDWIEAGVTIGYFQSAQSAFYTDYTDVDGSEIENQTKIRDIPVAVTVRAFPIGRTTPVQPYVGGGIVFHRWRYSETGEFVDFTPGGGLPIFRGNFVDDGSAVGPTVLGGVRVPIGRHFFAGGEVRWQWGSGDLDPDLNFAGSKLDLGGVSFMAGMHFKF